MLLFQLGADVKPPELRIHASPDLAATRTRLESPGVAGLADVVRLVGLRDPGSPVRVELANESSEWARMTAPWIAGFARGEEGQIVILPSRSPDYPHATLDDVLRHEVAHVLIYRASGGQPVPRWFNEGVALAAERQWRFGDQTRLFYELLSGSRESLGALNRLFEGSQQDQARAYLLAGALVRDLMDTHGETMGARILEKMRNGEPFEAAFLDVTGRSSAAADSEFWNRHRVWTTWIPIVFSQEVLWMLITLLALLAIYRRRQRNAEMAKQWEEEGDD